MLSDVSRITLPYFVAMLLGSSVFACGRDDDCGSGVNEGAPLSKWHPDCAIPSGKFSIESVPVVVQLGSGACDLDYPFEQLIAYDGTAQSLVDPGCTGSTTKSLADVCAFEVTERCGDVSTRFTLTLYSSGRIEGTQVSDNARCTVRYSLLYERLLEAKIDHAALGASAALASAEISRLIERRGMQ